MNSWNSEEIPQSLRDELTKNANSKKDQANIA